MLCCCAGCSYLKLRKRRDGALEDTADTAVVMDSSLSRMEANISVYSKQQEMKRKQQLLKAFDKHSLVITPQNSLSEGCTICLTAYQAGDVAVRSSSTEACRHVFHRDCIASWLMTRQSLLCPCCRQAFIHHDLTPYTRSASTISEEASGSEEESATLDDSSDDHISNESIVRCEDGDESGGGSIENEEPGALNPPSLRHTASSRTRQDAPEATLSSASDEGPSTPGRDHAGSFQGEPPATSLNGFERIQEAETPLTSSRDVMDRDNNTEREK